MTIIIRHLGGPLSGLSQLFDDSFDEILFGRSPTADVVYPTQCTTIEKEHFKLRRSKFGHYSIEPLNSHYIEVDGAPARNGMAVKSGSTLRLGDPEGPSFPGERWKQRVLDEIDRSDVFFLFWSSHARASQEVSNEIKHALKRQALSREDLPDIKPIVLEGPPPPEPPEELRHLHFNDPLIYVLAAATAQSTRSRADSAPFQADALTSTRHMRHRDRLMSHRHH